MRGLLRVIVVIAVCGWSALATTLADARLRQLGFVSPSSNISCELDDNGHAARPIPTRAYCQTRSPARSVTMSASGRLRLCRGENCLGDPGTARPLAYGRTTRLGPFTCRSLRSGVRCTTRGGRGFQISRGGIRRL